MVEITPEKVAVVSFKSITNDHLFETAVRIGHTIGNLHRPIRLEDNKIFIPIQADSELDLLKRLFGQQESMLKFQAQTLFSNQKKEPYT